MIRFYVDFNDRRFKDSVNIRLDTSNNALYRDESLIAGLKVVVYDEGTECDAILRELNDERWTADLILESIKYD